MMLKKPWKEYLRTKKSKQGYVSFGGFSPGSDVIAAAVRKVEESMAKEKAK
jgi:hypothetical protein